MHVSSVVRRKATSPFTLTNYVSDGYRADPASCPKPSISVRVLDQAVWDRISALLKRPEVTIAELRRLDGTDPVAAELQAAERSLAEADRRQANLAASIAITDDADVRAVLVENLTDAIAQRKRMEAERDRLVERQSVWKAGQADLADLAGWCHAMASTVDDLDYDTRRLLLDALDVRVRVAKSTDEERPRWQISAALPLDQPLPLASVSTTQLSNSPIATCTT